jgi:type IV pilus assembly protein PilY1
MIFLCALFGTLIPLNGAVFGQDPCKTPLFITRGVSPNVLVIFDTSGSMSNIIWLDAFDPLCDYSTPLLSQGKAVVFAREAGTCYLDHHRVSYQTAAGKVKLRYRNYTSPTEICSGTDYQTQWSESDGYFYFDRSLGAFIARSHFDSDNPDHIKVSLPYASYSVDVGDTGQDSTWYDYNYMNWIFYHSTENDRKALNAMQAEKDKKKIRMLTAKEAVKEIVKSHPDVRFGIMRLRPDNQGGQIVANITSGNDVVEDAVNTLKPEGGTPLAEALEDAWDYFSDPHNGPIEHWCQKNFVILMTDGQPTMDADNLGSDIKKDWDNDSGGNEGNRYAGNGSDYLDDIAYYMYQTEARPDLQQEKEKRNIVTYTIGFTTGNQLLLDTAFNGNGLHGREAEWRDPESPLYHKYYYRADEYEGLREALAQTLREISKSVSSGTAVAIVSTTTGKDDLLFRASFHPVGWKGFLDAFEAKENRDFDPANAKWRAGNLLQAMRADDRHIYTAFESVTGIDEKVGFTQGNVAKTDAMGNQLFKLLNTTNANDGKDIIQFIRGEAVEGFRDRRGYRLGDIVHSRPVVVGRPEGYSTDSAYMQFRRDHRSRDTMLYVGANDGMLHAFYVDDPQGGREAWAFIPNSLLGKLRDLASPDYDDCHEYFVDLTPTVVDVFIDPDGVGSETRQWRTILIGGEREGGTAYFSLDVTEPDVDQVRPLWEFSDSRLGESWSVPVVRKIKVGDRDKWLAFVGNGFNNEDGKGYLFAIDLESGQNLEGTPLTVSLGVPNILASPQAIDLNGDDYADSLFAGDHNGVLYRFNITHQTGETKTFEPLDPANWEARKIFDARNDEAQTQPITLPVGFSFYCKSSSDRKCQNLMIYFGTGKFMTHEDKTDTTVQSFYAIKDEFSDLVTRDQMSDRTASGNCEAVPDPYTMKGWYVDLTRKGERVSSPPLVMGGLVFFLTFIPADDPCKAGGETWLYYREFDTGCVPDRTVFGEDPDPGEGRPVGRVLIGVGYASEMAYYARMQEMLIQTSDTKIHGLAVALPEGGIENYAWREVFY